VAPGVELSVPFSDPGDSGSLIVLKSNRRPIGLLWGGQTEQLRAGSAQENWTYATRLDNIFKELKLELITDVNQFD
jgi:hypothetical protein